MIGFQTLDFDFSALGDEAFLPSTTTRDNAIFVFEQAKYDPVTLQFGLRYDNTKVSADGSESFGPGLSARSTRPAVRSGALFDLRKDYVLAASAVYTQRPPNYQELFADGPHVATGLFEVGDRGLPIEKSVGFDIALRKTGERGPGACGYFYNRFTDYMALLNTGEVEDDLPVYRVHVGRQGDLPGGRGGGFVRTRTPCGRRLATRPAGRLAARDRRVDRATVAQDLAGALRRRALAYTRDQWNARSTLQRVQTQDRVAPDELPDRRLHDVDASFTYQLTRGQARADRVREGREPPERGCAQPRVDHRQHRADGGTRRGGGLRGTF